ncbi:nuclear transport factor 2 family protein [Saccharothrix sp. 6-C]|uniref:Ketosteroid isomerase-like protein n=1 Tax=Saccharothrix texasensis TaxID=103734 RepID=A0A3N1GZB5_9PSEU|nr:MULTISPECIES: nuclear transport factor 2 family protein [Saccharothrix]QQQ80052.1 nuclear transport factor 2 family protein [Saccharothrix sp. 6-C]ROP35650.1 ketosteroid isomerase-like protein [Saccharothrix texasensis]
MTAQIDLQNMDLTDDPDVQNDVFLAAFNSGQGAIFDSLYRDDSISNLSGEPLTGQARTDAITALLATKPKLTSKVRANYTAGDTSLIIVDYDLEVTKPDGGKQRILGKCTDVLVRGEDGKWVMAVDRPVADSVEDIQG